MIWAALVLAVVGAALIKLCQYGIDEDMPIALLVPIGVLGCYTVAGAITFAGMAVVG